MLGVRFKDVQSIAWDLLSDISEGVDWQEMTQNWSKTEFVLVTGICHMKKRLPADFNPILSFKDDLVNSNDSSRTSL